MVLTIGSFILAGIWRVISGVFAGIGRLIVGFFKFLFSLAKFFIGLAFWILVFGGAIIFGGPIGALIAVLLMGTWFGRKRK